MTPPTALVSVAPPAVTFSVEFWASPPPTPVSSSTRPLFVKLLVTFSTLLKPFAWDRTRMIELALVVNDPAIVFVLVANSRP